MEFSVNCPIDGVVEVSLEDIDTVVLRDTDKADITFVCPHCGTQIQVSAIVPSFLLAAIEALADDGDGVTSDHIIVVSGSSSSDDRPVPEIDDPRADAYCEYFRRQLERVECAEDALDEIDSRSTYTG